MQTERRQRRLIQAHQQKAAQKDVKATFQLHKLPELIDGQ